MEPSPDLIDVLLKWTERLGPMTMITLSLMTLIGWIIVKMMRQYFSVLPQLPTKMQELTTATNGLRSDVREALRALEAYRQGRLDPYYQRDRSRSDRSSEEH